MIFISPLDPHGVRVLLYKVACMHGEQSSPCESVNVIDIRPKYCIDPSCLSARLQSNFHDRIGQLIYTFPEDANTSTGSLFWSAPKRFPQVLSFNASDASHATFAQAAAVLKAEVHGISLPSWASDATKVSLCCQLSCSDVSPANRKLCLLHSLMWLLIRA